MTDSSGLEVHTQTHAFLFMICRSGSQCCELVDSGLVRTHRTVLVPHVPAHYYDPQLPSTASVCAHHKRLAANWGRGPTMTGWKFARIRTDVT